jgi:phosphatidate cytidylyltransferase
VLFASNTQAGIGLIGVSIAVSMASQIGDIAESAIKRRAGVKDSSRLIPGHGGLLDRFDGMLGAALFIVIAGQLVGFPPGTQ